MSRRKLPPIPNGPLKGKTMVFSGQEEADQLRPEIELILDALEVEWAWISDESMIGHFPIGPYDGDDLPTLSTLREKLGVPVKLRDFVIDVAWRMRRAKTSS